MRILPPRTHPARIPSARRHTPSSGDYTSYRACLRWEFGFTCAFCLLHENDFVGGEGISGLGLYWIEHRLSKKLYDTQRDSYVNCLYSCRLCNRARGITPVMDGRGRKLLDPTTTAWSRHFSVDNDQLVPRSQDGDAQYTEETYELNDPRKRKRRALRRRAITESRHTLEKGQEQLEELRDLASRLPDIQRAHLACDIALIQERIDCARRDLERFGAIPRDCGSACRCASSEHHALPPWLHEQTFETPHPSH